MKSRDRAALLENERRFYRNQEHIDFYAKQGNPRQIFAHEQVRSCLLKALRSKGCGSQSRVLNLACGTGEMDMDYVLPLTQRVVGIDVTIEALSTFRGKYDLPCVNGDVLTLPFRQDAFDFVVCSGLLHHLISQGRMEDFLLEFKRVLRPGGWLIANEPNLFFPNGFPMLILQKIKPGILGLVPGERPLSPFYLLRQFRKSGFGNVGIEASSYVYNRFPLFLSKAIAQVEEKIRRRPLFNLLGWWTLVSGQKRTSNS